MWHLNSPEALMDSFLKEVSLREEAVKTCWGQLALVIRSRRMLHVMGRQKGKMQKIYFQIKNGCIDLGGNGFTKTGGLTANSLKNRHKRVFCLHSPASFHHSAAMPLALPRAWEGAVEGHRVQTITLPGCEGQLQRWQVRRSAQVCWGAPAGCWPGGCSPAAVLVNPRRRVGLPQAGLQWTSLTASALLKGTKPRNLRVRLGEEMHKKRENPWRF